MTNERQEETAVLADLTRKRIPKIPALTGIRGYAACWVVFYHLDEYSHHPGQALFAIRSGYLGVDLFFLLSGFVLMLTYGLGMVAPGWGKVRDFAIGRVMRILPLHWLMLLAFALMVPILHGHWLLAMPHTAASMMIEAALVQGWLLRSSSWNPPTWSLSTEWLVYLVFPLLALVIGRIMRWWLALAGALGALLLLAVVCFASHQVGLDHVQRLGLLRCLLEFPAGMLLCRLWQLCALSRRQSEGFFIAGLTLLIAALLGRSLDILALPGFALLLLSCVGGSRSAQALFGNRVAHFLGEISFSIYLVHWLFLELALRAAEVIAPGSLAARFALLPLVPLLTLPIAYLTWRRIEIPGQAVGRVWIADLRARSPVPQG